MKRRRGISSAPSIALSGMACVLTACADFMTRFHPSLVSDCTSDDPQWLILNQPPGAAPEILEAIFEGGPNVWEQQGRRARWFSEEGGSYLVCYPTESGCGTSTHIVEETASGWVETDGRFTIC